MDLCLKSNHLKDNKFRSLLHSFDYAVVSIVFPIVTVKLWESSMAIIFASLSQVIHDSGLLVTICKMNQLNVV